MRKIFLVTVGLCLAGCSDRPNPEDGGPIWPDLVLDWAVPDAPRPDRALPDISVGDRPVTEGGGPAWQSAQVGAEDLHAVACLPGGHLFVAGDKGTMLYRGPASPPGINFTKQSVGVSSPVTVDLYTVTFADPTYGATAGKDWQIWETKDQGKNWNVAPQCSAFVFEVFHSLHLSAAGAGFGAGVAVNGAGGGYKYYSGYSWVCGPTPYPGEVFLDVVRQDKLGWIVGATGGKIYRTEDEGATWVGYAAGTTETLRAVALSGNSGLAVGDKGTIVASSDGKAWSTVTSGVTVDLYGVTLQSAQDGWAVGEGGTLLRTKDGGQSWTPQSPGVTARLEAVCFTSAMDGWAVGQGGTVVHTITGGE